jgi:hypothetical protein
LQLRFFLMTHQIATRNRLFRTCYSLLVLTLANPFSSSAQPITGLWKGKIKSTKIELKLVKKGDSLVGTSYYFESPDIYRRYSIRGYFDDQAQNVVWWDEELLEEKMNTHGVGSSAMMMVADFNCPGEGVMKLEGRTSERDNTNSSRLPLDLQKTGSSIFPDEWDFVLSNYTRGASDSRIIDSVAFVSTGISVIPAGYEEAPIQLSKTAIYKGSKPDTEKRSIEPPRAEVKSPDLGPLTVAQKFSTRSKILQTIIPVSGDSIELRFYDNAEIDGDSIAIFLNGTMLQQHILLSDLPHVLKIPMTQLGDDNELVMVAENLGSIPPNTSLMVAIVGENHYEARLQSSEGSSALVRFVKQSSSDAKKPH